MLIKKLSIIIPAYNEKSTIREIIRRVQAVDLGRIEKEIIVVDDGSTDGTREILKTIPGIKYIFHEKNLGKGGAVKTGFKAAEGDALIPQDADLEYDPNDFPALISPILENKTEAVLGVRIDPEKDERKKKSFYWLAWLGNKAITWTTNILFWNNGGEYEGCYKVFTKRLIDSINAKSNGFEYDNELVCKILKSGYKTFNVPIRYYPRNYKQGKKIKPKDGLKILWTIIKYRFVE